MFFILLSLALSKACKPIKCTSGSTSSTCLDSSTSVSLTKCTPSQTCPIDSLDSILQDSSSTLIECTPIPSTASCPTSATTGDYCCEDSNCSTKKCSSNRCEGYFIYEPCERDSDCEPESYCKPSVGQAYGSCTKAFTKGDDCDFDNECASGLGCSRGSCVQLFSLSNGKLADKDSFCITQLRNDNNECDSIEVYVNGNLLKNPFQCNIGETCVYKYKGSGDKYDESECRCDGTQNGVGYCSDYVNYDYDIAQDIAQHIEYTSSLCSGDDASSVDVDVLIECESIDLSSYYYIQNATAVFTFWSVYQSGAADGCALDLELFDPAFTFSFACLVGVVYWKMLLVYA